MRKLWFLMLAAVFAAGCNTFQGLGKDISKAGETIENASKKKQ